MFIYIYKMNTIVIILLVFALLLILGIILRQFMIFFNLKFPMRRASSNKRLLKSENSMRASSGYSTGNSKVEELLGNAFSADNNTTMRIARLKKRLLNSENLMRASPGDNSGYNVNGYNSYYSGDNSNYSGVNSHLPGYHSNLPGYNSNTHSETGIPIQPNTYPKTYKERLRRARQGRSISNVHRPKKNGWVNHLDAYFNRSSNNSSLAI